MNVHLATPATRDAALARTLRRLVHASAAVYGVKPEMLGPGAKGRHPSSGMPEHVLARYAAIHIATERRLGILADIVMALGYAKPGAITLNGAGMRDFRRLAQHDALTRQRLADIEQRLDAPPGRVHVPAMADPTDAALYGASPRQVTGARLRQLRRDGWSIKGLCRQYIVDELTMRQVLREPIDASMVGAA